MAMFKPGLRVRIVWTDKPSNHHLIGQEDVVVGFWPDGSGDVILGSHPRPDGGNCIRADYLEPILPSGAAPSEFRTLADILQSLGQGVPA